MTALLRLLFTGKNQFGIKMLMQLGCYYGVE